ncbi:hypothetical protein I3842_11G132700 [Carya illinoinensis]|uniref:Uncharacterized protein n=1 Tax=Carya illinoinensis TaxID=32201 RepID=A0A922DQT0_CARIL|nr:hypothetical protein I3842_11G132700 [Carya illinoinensis]
MVFSQLLRTSRSTSIPSLQTALPSEFANNLIRNLLRLFNNYKQSLPRYLRRAKYTGHRQFKRHMHETDPERIQKLKDDTTRGLINHILYESEKMSGRKFNKTS